MAGPLPRLTLVQLFVWATLVLAVALGATFGMFLEGSRRSIVARSDLSRDAEARRIASRLSGELGLASKALESVELSLRFGVIAADDVVAAEGRLFAELLSHPTLSDLSLTHATLLGHEPGGDARIRREDAWQISVFRLSADPSSAIVTRRVRHEGERFVAEVRRRRPGAGLLDAPFEPAGTVADPTAHATFEAALSRPFYGKSIWSDLSYSEIDAARPAPERRVIVTVQRAVEDRPGHFAGVVRVGLTTRQIDELPRLETTASQRVLLSDRDGRLVARVDPDDRIELTGDDLRVVSARPRPEVAAALASGALRELSAERPARSERLEVAGASYLVTFRALDNSQGWIAAIVVPEAFYTGDLRALQRRFVLTVAAATALVLLTGGIVLQRLRSSLGRVVAETNRMRNLDFSPSLNTVALREPAEVLEGLERAKTSMRALEKYVPVDLVRELFRLNREPELGGELVEISLCFSDIEGFTTLAERLTPDALARALGQYLAAMTRAIRSTEGTVDKFIGDAVMAFWNAPTRCEDHARRACRAVLACMRENRALFESPAWEGLPPLVTRFGVHRAKVMVGHFGAPQRLSYTALGDGVNLASRLEGLGKQYGVAALVSEAVVEQAGDEFAFRLIDKVAVKGKLEAVRVYELLGLRAECSTQLARASIYERALASYFARDFQGALSMLATLQDDPAARVLATRCEAMLERPPPPGWSGVFVATTK